jgi:phosphonate transport system permease protein
MRALGLVLAALAAAGVWAALYLDLSPGGLWPGRGGLRLAGEFFGRAFSPALRFEGPYAGDTLSLPLQALGAAFNTVVFAAAALSLALLGGLALGFLGSSTWWDRGPGRAVTAAARLFMALMRSVHELVWAVLLLAAFGTSHLAAVFAIAIPYAGTLGKVFAEMIDEAPRDAADALGQSGANALQCFACGLLPRAAPDMTAYTFYRFECALRSSAVLGFFGFPTLGYYIAASFENLYYGEVWTYLYVLFALIAGVDWWSSRLRREVLA